MRVDGHVVIDLTIFISLVYMKVHEPWIFVTITIIITTTAVEMTTTTKRNNNNNNII